MYNKLITISLSRLIWAENAFKFQQQENKKN